MKQKVKLTPRELEVLRMMCAGNRNVDIAEQLGISTRTMEHYAAVISEKLGGRGNMSRYAIGVLAERAGLLKGVIPA